MYKVRFNGYLDNSPYGKKGVFIVGNVYEVYEDPEDRDLRVFDEEGDPMWERAESFTRVEVSK